MKCESCQHFDAAMLGERESFTLNTVDCLHRHIGSSLANESVLSWWAENLEVRTHTLSAIVASSWTWKDGARDETR